MDPVQPINEMINKWIEFNKYLEDNATNISTNPVGYVPIYPFSRDFAGFMDWLASERGK